MKVFYDARWILIENRFDGVSRYSHELARELAKQPDIDITWIIHDERQLKKLPKGAHFMANDPNNGIAELGLPRRLNKAGAEVVYSPFFVMGTMGKKYKLVLTIHDLIYFTHRTPPQWLPWLTRLGWRLFHLTYWPLRWQLNRADHIATVSETACNELLSVRATKRPITTVPNAVSDTFIAADQDHSTMDGVVYMGAFTPYKNVECVIDAVSRVPNTTLHLLSKIPPSRRPEIEAYLEKAGVASRTVIHNGASDEVYIQTLAKARCAISASRLEGFGLPLIEAQQAGVPFVAANTPIFHEIGQKSVLYFDPDKPEEAAAHIVRLADTDTNRDVAKKGRKNAARYTWQASASQARTILSSL